MVLPLIGAGVVAGASLLGSAMAADSAEKANATNVKLARMQQNFQRQQRRTSYQTAVHDMVRAGLNPMLAYSQGGAPVMSGSSATVQPTIKGNPLGEAASSAMAAYRGQAEIEVMETQAQKNQADATLSSAQTAKVAEETKAIPVGVTKTQADTELSRVTANLQDNLGALTIQQRNKVMTEVEHMKNQIAMQQYTARSASAQARVDEAKAEFADVMKKINSSNWGESLITLDRIMQSLGFAKRAWE